MMLNLGKAALCASATVIVAGLVGGEIGARRASALSPGSELASHRAVYELRLAQSRGNSSTMSARGRILYDFSGNACEGYALQFRQVSELDNGEGMRLTTARYYTPSGRVIHGHGVEPQAVVEISDDDESKIRLQQSRIELNEPAEFTERFGFAPIPDVQLSLIHI